MASFGAASRTLRGSFILVRTLGVTLLALAAACGSEEPKSANSSTPSTSAADSAPSGSSESNDPLASHDSTPIPTTVWSEAFATWSTRLEQRAPGEDALRNDFRRWLANLAADIRTRAASASTPEFHVDSNTLGQACQLAESVFSDDPLPLDELSRWLSCLPRSGPSVLAAYHAYLLAYILASRGEYDEAREVLIDVENRFPSETYLIEERWTALAQVHRELGTRGDAQAVVGKLLNRLRTMGRAQSEDYARALAVRADIAIELGQMERALADLDAAREVSLAVESRDLEFEIYMSMLGALLAQGRSERVLRLTASLANRSQSETAQIQVSRGTALLHMGKSDARHLAEAATTLDAALACATLPPEFRAFAVNRRIEVALARGQDSEALDHFSKLGTDRSAIRDRLLRDEATGAHFDLVSLLSEIEIAKRSDAMHEQLDLHRNALGCLLRSWRTLGLDAEGIGRMHLAWPNRLITSLIQLELVASPGAAGETNAVEVLLQAHAAFGLAEAIPGPTASLAQLRSSLAADHGILAIQAAPTACLAIWLEKTEVAFFQLPGSQEIESLARSVNRQLDENGTDTESIESSIDALTAALLPPELKREVEQARLLTIASADLLGSPAFEVLPHSAGGSLGEHVAIDRTTSLVAWHRLRSRDGELRDAALVASLSPSSRHRGVDSERTGAVPADYATRVLAAWSSRKALVFVDQTATVDSFRLAAAQPQRFLHLLGHGVWEAESDIGAVISVTPSPTYPDGVISEREIRRLPSCAPVIMLSSCRIGATKQRIGDSDLNSLGGAFLRQGARSVIQSRFPLQIGHHSRFAGRVHALLAAGATVADAVRQARRDFAQHSRSPDVLREIAMEVLGYGH
ncbi:MAG: CHAT domain-containing protein [Planctomycetota bacterium]